MITTVINYVKNHKLMLRQNHRSIIISNKCQTNKISLFQLTVNQISIMIDE